MRAPDHPSTARPDVSGPTRTLQARSLTVAFTIEGQRHVVLVDVGLNLHPGKLTALVGASGSGKSTLLRVLGLLTPPDSGSVTIHGRSAWDVKDARRSRLRRQHLGFVFQSANLIPQLRARHNVALAFDGPLAQGLVRADELLDQMGVLDRAHSRSADMSGGEQQRVAMARALVNSPAVLLADEPTGSLDPTNADHVLRLIRAVCERPCAVLVVTHSPKVADSADRVLRLTGGHLVTERSAA